MSGRDLEALIKQSGMSMAEFSRMMGISQSTCWRLRDSEKISRHYEIAIRSVLGLSEAKERKRTSA